MYFLALAADFDGTIAEHGTVRSETVRALRELKASGRQLLLVTGRELVDLQHAFAELDVFDRVVAENGAVIYQPATAEQRSIAPAPPAAFIQTLIERHVEPISVGHAIVATWHPHENTVLQVIQEMGLELHIVFNKGAVMVLPANVNKLSGLLAALQELDLSPLNVVAVGDAENDHAFLRACGCSAAVANALPAVSGCADIRLKGDHGAGVVELAHRMMQEDSHLLPASRRGILAGMDRLGEAVWLEPEQTILIAGTSGSGKSHYATLLTERMVAGGFEFCIIDPEGDYLRIDDAVVIGSSSEPPLTEEALRLLLRAGVNVVINALALNLEGRRRLFAMLLPSIRALRARSGRPHWLLVDEAHHTLSTVEQQIARQLPHGLPATILITVDPASIAQEVLQSITVILAFGSGAAQAIASFAGRRHLVLPAEIPRLASDEMLVWMPESGLPIRAVRRDSPHQAHDRHTGKYALGDVGEQRSFYFRGPGNTLNRRARNLGEFLRIASEIDDTAWQHHLRAGDYSAWFRNVIMDETLAQITAAVEGNPSLDARESRRQIRDAVCGRYQMPAV